MTREELARECLKIEKADGNVLEYIAKEMPSYTPRAAWYNIQKEILKRGVTQITEGKPEPHIEKGKGKGMGKMIEMARAACEAAETGEKIHEFLRSQGYKNPSAVWYLMKKEAKEKDSALYVRMGEVMKQQRAKLEKPETVTFNGKEYEKAEKPKATVRKVEKVPEAELVCDPDILDEYSKEQKEKAGKAEEPEEDHGITKPMQCGGLAIKAVEGAFGWYSRSINGEMIGVRTKDGEEISLKAAAWKGFLFEIKEAFRVLGIDPE